MPLTNPTTAATQSEMEATTSISSFATPARTQYHPGIAKGWVNFNASTGSPVIRTSYNVSSVSDDGVGTFTVNWSTAFSTSYSVAVFPSTTGANDLVIFGKTDDPTTSGVGISCMRISTLGLVDIVCNCVVAFGDQ